MLWLSISQNRCQLYRSGCYSRMGEYHYKAVQCKTWTAFFLFDKSYICVMFFMSLQDRAMQGCNPSGNDVRCRLVLTGRPGHKGLCAG